MNTQRIDQHGRTVLATGQYDITIIPQFEHTPCYVHLDEDVLAGADAELARLQAEEANLGDLRWRKKVDCGGDHPLVDALYQAMNDRYMIVALRVACEILPELAGLVDGDLTTAADTAYFSRKAGCSMCPCSPGVVLGSPLKVAGRRVDIFVSAAS